MIDYQVLIKFYVLHMPTNLASAVKGRTVTSEIREKVYGGAVRATVMLLPHENDKLSSVEYHTYTKVQHIKYQSI